MHAIKSFERILTTATAAAVITMVALMVAITAAAVVFRYVFNSPLAWSEEAAKYLMVWMTFLAGSLATKRGAHVSIDFLQQIAAPRLRRISEWVTLIGSAAFLVVLLVWGTGFAYGVRHHSNPIIGGLSMSVPYGAVPVGALLMLIQLGFAFFLRSTPSAQGSSVGGNDGR